MAANDGLDLEFDTKNLRRILAKVKEEQGPAMQRNLRRNLRGVGDGIIAGQRGLLDAAPPGVAKSVGTKIVKVKAKDGRLAYARVVNIYEAQQASRKRSNNLRGRIKKSLKTRIVAGKTRSGIRIQAAKTPSGGEENKYDMAKVWNKKVFRHSVFGSRKNYVTQFGQPYWWGPIKAGGAEARKQAEQAINDALNGRG